MLQLHLPQKIIFPACELETQFCRAENYSTLIINILCFIIADLYFDPICYLIRTAEGLV